MALPKPLSFEMLGGAKVDYQPIDDPATDRSAEQVNNAFAAIAGMSATAIKAVVRFDGVDTLGPVVIAGFASVWGAGISQRPSVSRTGTGRYEIAFPAQITSLLGTLEDLNIVVATASVSSINQVDLRASCRVDSPNVLTIQVVDITGNVDTTVEQISLVIV